MQSPSRNLCRFLGSPRVTFTCTDTDPVPFSETLTSVFPTEIQQVDALGLMRSAAAENVASLAEK